MNNNLEEVKKAEDLGKKIGFLIAPLIKTDEDREAWMTVISEMAEDQLRRLADILESKAVEGLTASVDEELSKNLTEIREKYAQKVRAADEAAINALEDLEKQISK